MYKIVHSLMLFREKAPRNFGYNISFIVQYIPKYKSQAIDSSSLYRFSNQALAVSKSILTLALAKVRLWPFIYLAMKL